MLATRRSISIMSTSNYQFPPSSPPPLSPPHLEDNGDQYSKAGLLPAFHPSTKPGLGYDMSSLSSKDGHLPTSFRKGLLDSSPSRGSHAHVKPYNDKESKLKQSLDEMFFNTKTKVHQKRERDNMNSRSNKTMSYPTPLPTSSVGERSSSPIREHNLKEVHVDAAAKDGWFGHNSDSEGEDDDSVGRRILLPAANSHPKLIQPTYAPSEFKSHPFIVRNPLSNMKILDFVAHQAKTVKIGRSSRCCNLQINKKNKQISREHLVVKYVPSSKKSNEDNYGYFLIKCLGWNGVIIYFPPGVSQASSSPVSSSAFATVNGKSDDEQKSINDENVKEQFLFKDQLVQVDAVAGIIIDIRGERILVQFDSDPKHNSRASLNVDETEDEIDNHCKSDDFVDKSLDQKIETGSCLGTTIFRDARVPENVVHCSNKPETASYPTESISEIENVRQASDPRPSHSSKPHGIISDKNSRSSITSENSTSHLGGESEIEPETHEVKRVRYSTPITVTAKSSGKISKSQTSQTIAKPIYPSTVEHTSGASISDSDDSVPIVSEFNIANLKTIICNHLAFSRLSSTPISIIQGSSASLTPVPKGQLRTVIKSIECVGVISRHGKDAAGKILEEEYYYIPENDNDEGRKFMLAQIKGHGGLRSCRKTHKQYYWKKPKI
ncbi:hypothetical protein NADFUDRAFT_48682 [Nadsonia fulvescens var. elongata DSM 6958]|uniref:FHA domain-containing protein n=1 Tax=Nadsonia fulvescens var. elongata DSM 6958 TaxID=857566 RepID=A0A1E3PSX2_9ASCO|nr:hypothetical protein NADFUDRAFT_48682 [Nadsonia fulvescens var. elongata DSM 6958]